LSSSTSPSSSSPSPSTSMSSSSSSTGGWTCRDNRDFCCVYPWAGVTEAGEADRRLAGVAGVILIDVVIVVLRPVNNQIRKTSNHKSKMRHTLLVACADAAGLALEEVEVEIKPFPSANGCANAFLKLSLIANAGFLPGAPKLSTPPTTLPEVMPASAISPAGFKFMLAVACVATSSGGSPCRSLTLEMSTSSLARVLVISSISFSANATFSAANSCISV